MKVISNSVETCPFDYEFYVNEHKHISLANVKTNVSTFGVDWHAVYYKYK